MKKVILILVNIFILSSIIILGSCESEQDVQNDIDKLRNERKILQDEVLYQKEQIIKNKKNVSSLKEEVKELEIYHSGKTPKYILKLKLKQSHISLDVGRHLKDAMNRIEFEIPVDKEFYHSINIGEKLVDEFRTGSLILEGSFGNWEMTVIDKNIK